jgi:DNA-binding MarR family transcriptional regulator
LGVSRQFVQTVCNDLFEREYIAFRDNPRHKRSRLTTLTDSGRRAFRMARLSEDEMIEKALPGVDPDQATAARLLLAGIRKALANAR